MKVTDETPRLLKEIYALRNTDDLRVFGEELSKVRNSVLSAPPETPLAGATDDALKAGTEVVDG